jgi:FAD/FMN-containing dehydrogenase/Fe-S oxidoreductase
VTAPISRTRTDLRTDPATRALYATDASIHQVTPAAVAFPTDAAQVASLMGWAANEGLSVTPRGAGSGLVGGALGDGLVIDLSRHLIRLGPMDPDTGQVTVGPGVVLDALNRSLAPHGRWFGPDVATASRATLGGMVANNSSGAHAPVYGPTARHVEALELVLADGRIAWVGDAHTDLESLRSQTQALVEAHASAVRERMPDVLVKRWPGYGLDGFLDHPDDLARLVAGSEGTLAVITAARLRTVPRPATRSLAVIRFASVTEAMQAAVDLLPLEPAAVEHLDRLVFGQSAGQAAFAPARALLGLDDPACESLLLVEFFDDDGDRVDRVRRSNLGLGTVVCADGHQRELVWGLRRAGLSLVTGCAGPVKPTTCIEDACVRPEDLPAYVAGLREILNPEGLEASFYGHAASGLLHVRPALDLHLASDIARLRRVSDQVSELVARFGGSLCGEHGLGMTRTEYAAAHLGNDLIEVHRRIKALFDPEGRLNPGKVVDTGRWALDRDLRIGPGTELRLPTVERLGFVDRDLGFAANLEQCNGCGGCRKATPSMCPTFIATAEEVDSTRGRANLLRAALEGRLPGGIDDPQLAEALGTCLSCKACRRECPSGVDLAALKAEALQARHERHGPSLADRVIAHADLLGRLGSATAPVTNWILRRPTVRWAMERTLGLDRRRELPTYDRHRFDHWFRRRPAGEGGSRGTVLLWDDTWTRYHQTTIGRAAVEVLEALGFTVRLVDGRRCCGRPAASRGLLDEVAALGRHNLALMADLEPDAPVVFLEPSCWSVFVDEYRQLRLPGADTVARRCVVFEDLVAGIVEEHPEALHLARPPADAAVHSHCHHRALADGAADGAQRVLAALGTNTHSLEAGCCGMAGAFGLMREHSELSRAVATPLVRQIREQGTAVAIVASGTSCRHQINDMAGRSPRHLAEVLAEAL